MGSIIDDCGRPSDFDVRKAWEDACERNREYQAKIERLTAQLSETKKRANKFQRERAELFDKLNGTPCEQIRHDQEVKEFREKIERLTAPVTDAELIRARDTYNKKSRMLPVLEEFLEGRMK